MFKVLFCFFFLSFEKCAILNNIFPPSNVLHLLFLCRLWKCDSIELHDLPNVWLKDLIVAISSGNSDNSKLCATRRSAGVPFIIQVLIYICVFYSFSIDKNKNTNIFRLWLRLNYKRIIHQQVFRCALQNF